MDQLYRVVYCSRNCVPGSAEAIAAEISTILAKSRINNARDGVTGGLLFSKNCFAQVLEGSADAVEAAFERIQCDERHSEVTVISSGTISSRDFAQWSMAFTGEATMDNPLAGVVLEGAFSGQTSGGDDVLDLLRGIVVRETEWLASV